MAAEDDLYEAAVAAERRVEASARAALGDGLRERILAGALAKGAVAPAAAPVRRARLGSKAAAALVATALAAGALGHAVGRRDAPRPPPQPQPQPMPMPMPPPLRIPVPVPMPLPYPVPAPAPAPKRRPSADMNEPLLVDQARAALRRKLPEEAILALERHEREFPDGQLVEEREVLFIEAELMKGETQAARARITRYLERFPHGLLRGYVESLAPPAP